MKNGYKLNYFALGLSSVFILAGCGGGGSGGSEATDTTTLNSHYFVGNTTTNGRELWKSDGSESGTVMVKDINNLGHSNPANFTQVGDTIFFTANPVNTKEPSSIEIWKYNSSGTSLVSTFIDINTNIFLAHNGKLYFEASNSDVTNGLWESDGTAEGTIQVGAFSNVENVTAIPGGLLYFTLNSSELWKYDGITVPSVPAVSATFSLASSMVAIGSQLYFIAYTDATGYELWTSNGFAAGTNVLDVTPGPTSTLSSGSKLFNVNGVLVFPVSNVLWTSNGTFEGTVDLTVGDTATNAYITTYYPYTRLNNNGDLYFFYSSRLWRTNGTPAGTYQVSNQYFSSSRLKLIPGNELIYISSYYDLWVSDSTQDTLKQIESYAYPYQKQNLVATVGNMAFYTRRKQNNDGYQLVVSNGITSGSKVLKEFRTYRYAYDISLFGGNDKLYMSFPDDEAGMEPWVSDGTVDGTTPLADLNSESPENDSSPYGRAVFNNTLYFIANDGIDDRGLWKTDGTDAGTVRLVKDVTDVYGLVVSGGKLYFVGHDGKHGHELWNTDGTEAGTQMVADLLTGDGNSSYPYSLTDVNGTLYFASDAGYLWKTNGTEESTNLVSLVTPYSKILAMNGKIYFTYSDDNGQELWVSDGTMVGTHIVKDINPLDSSVSYFESAIVSGNTLYFAANDGISGLELWKTDGTEAGTQMVVDLNETEDGLDSWQSRLYAKDDLLYFTAYNINSELEFWKTDGTAEGTMQLTNLYDTGGSIYYDAGFSVIDDHLYFTADNGSDGRELWRTNGTVDGTIMFKDINAVSSSYPYGFSVFNNTLFFHANDGIHGRELWKSDGTVEGTILVKDIEEGDLNGSEPLYEEDIEYD